MQNSHNTSEPLMIVKIDISMQNSPGIIDAVVYYNYKLPMSLALRYEWYFEYLAARLKVRHPHRRVNLYILRQDEILCGEDYVEAKTPTLIKGKKATITRLKNKTITDDLFNLARAERDKKIAVIQDEINALVHGEFNYYIPPTYINNVKNWLR